MTQTTKKPTPKQTKNQTETDQKTQTKTKTKHEQKSKALLKPVSCYTRFLNTISLACSGFRS